MSAPVVLRHSDAGDALQLKELRLLALRDEPDAYGSTYEQSRHYSDYQWTQMAAEWNYYLAFAGDEAVGMASGGLFAPVPEARWLYGMFVRTDHRGTDVAHRLVSAVARWTREQGVNTLGLHVTTSLPRPVAFYTRLGFVATGSAQPMQRDHALLLQTMTTDLSTNDRI